MLVKRRGLLGGAIAAGLLAGNTKTARAIGIFDDPSNTSGLGAPAILRGTVSTRNLAGLVVGAGQTTGVRQANATALQNALNYCAANNKMFEIVPNVYEINSSTGLLIPSCNGFVWRGEQYQSSIVQFYNGGTGAPIITMGDTVGSSASNGWEFHGVSATYGVSQTGLTSANPVICGNLGMCKVGGISIFNASFPSYNGFSWVAPGLGNFSNIYDNIIVWRVQNDFLHQSGGGTGNIIDNVYLNNGGIGTANPITGNYLNMASSTNDWHFRRLNPEWGACAKVLNCNNQIGLQFEALHIEGITFNAFGSIIMGVATSSVEIDVLDIIDLVAGQSSQSLIQDFVQGSSVVRIKELTWVNNNVNQVTTTFALYQPAASGVDDTPVFSIDGGYLRDATSPGTGIFQGGNHVFFDANMPVANFITPNKFGLYNYGVGGSSVQFAQIPVSATYTHYGQHSWATLQVPAGITSFTLTLAATVGATGTRLPPTGTVTRVRRQSGSASGTLTVKDDAGTTLSTNTTSGVDLFYIFNGTHYVTFTPEPG